MKGGPDLLLGRAASKEDEQRDDTEGELRHDEDRDDEGEGVLARCDAL